jgi:hypothetical protein
MLTVSIIFLVFYGETPEENEPGSTEEEPG